MSKPQTPWVVSPISQQLRKENQMRILALLLTVFGLITTSAAADEPGKKEPANVAREITERTPEAIQKQIDFTKEHLLLFKWSGSGRDKLEFRVEEGKEGPVVVFKLTPGLTRDLRQHSRLYAVTNNATWRIEGMPGRLKDPAKITRADDLPTHFPAPDSKQK
jgi:hypothetical protein